MFQNLIAAGLIMSGLATGSLSFNHPDLPKGIDSSYIIHAAGEIDGTVSTNSYEALVNAYQNGNRLIEIDFNFTYALEAVCVHDFNWAVFPEHIEDKRPTYSEFMKTKIYGKFTPMSLDMLAEFMASHTDLFIITDTKEFGSFLARKLKEEHPELMDRFVVQVYSEEEYHEVRELGFDKIIFTLYRLSWQQKTDTEHLVEFAKNNPLFAYTFPYELCDIDGYVDNMKKSGVPLFIHTLNDNSLMQKYFDMGINGIYTDNTVHN